MTVTDLPPQRDNEHPDVDHAAEQAVLGAAMANPAAIPDIQTAGLRPDTFARPHHTTIWQAVLALAAGGSPTDPVAVKAHLEQTRQLRGPLTANYLFDCYQAAPPAAQTAAWHAARLVTLQRKRDLAALGRRLVQLGQAPASDDEDVTQAYEAALTAVVKGIETDPTAANTPATTLTTIDDLLNEPEDEYDWLIPGLIERCDRLIVTGPEGGGKSTLLRQIAVMAASGIHPFTGETFTPLRVLYIDLENSRRQIRRKLRPLRLAAGDLLAGGNIYIETRMEGIDLNTKADIAWLLDITQQTRPDILCTGPIYKMASGDPNDEVSAKPIALALDQVRVRARCAIALETHTPHASGGARKRPIRPFGWSGWCRWPEFGIHLGDDGEIEHWRGQRDEREWPTLLKRGGQWPWTPENDRYEVIWRQIKQIRGDFGEYLSYRTLAKDLGFDLGVVKRVIARHRDEWQTLNGPPGKSDEL